MVSQLNPQPSGQQGVVLHLARLASVYLRRPATLLEEAHRTVCGGGLSIVVKYSHSGMVRMKAVARSYFWWPRLDQDIECLVKTCNAYNQIKSNPLPVTLHAWVWPSRPWKRLHLNFAVPLFNETYLWHSRRKLTFWHENIKNELVIPCCSCSIFWCLWCFNLCFFCWVIRESGSITSRQGSRENRH